MLDPRGIVIVDDYLAFPRTDSVEAIEKCVSVTSACMKDAENFLHHSNQASVIRCRLSSCDITIHLHEGYDWLSTRKAIEEEAKSVRRRLERIRQFLSSGQAPDASADEASTMMFGSIQLGLPPGAADLPPAQLLAAINEELNDASETVSNASSWQPLSAQSSPSRKSTTTAVTKKRRKLTRSRSYAIEINLRGIEASYDTYPEGKQLASRTRVDFESFDIIDNIRSSTWRKFLTELRASDGGVARSSGASMVRFEMRSVRPTGKTPEQSDEILFKVSQSSRYATRADLLSCSSKSPRFGFTSIRMRSIFSRRSELSIFLPQLNYHRLLLPLPLNHSSVSSSCSRQQFNRLIFEAQNDSKFSRSRSSWTTSRSESTIMRSVEGSWRK